MSGLCTPGAHRGGCGLVNTGARRSPHPSPQAFTQLVSLPPGPPSGHAAPLCLAALLRTPLSGATARSKRRRRNSFARSAEPTAEIRVSLTDRVDKHPAFGDEGPGSRHATSGLCHLTPRTPVTRPRYVPPILPGHVSVHQDSVTQGPGLKCYQSTRSYSDPIGLWSPRRRPSDVLTAKDRPPDSDGWTPLSSRSTPLR